MGTAIHDGWREHADGGVIGSGPWQGRKEASLKRYDRMKELRAWYWRLPTLLDEETALMTRDVLGEIGRDYRPLLITAAELWVALDAITSSQRLCVKACWMGMVRVYAAGRWQDAAWRDAVGTHRQMAYAECGDYLDLSAKAVGEQLRRAAATLVGRVYHALDGELPDVA